MKKIIKNLFLLLLLQNISFAQFDNAGTSVANFLKIGVGSRSEAMAGACVANVSDPSAMFWNVAGLSKQEMGEVVFSQNNWVADITHNYLGIGIPLENGTVGVSLGYLSMDDMIETTWDKTDGTGKKFSAYDFVIGIAYARRLTDRFLFGAQTKYINETIDQSTATAWAIDMGAIYETGWRKLQIGVTLQNFGTQMRLEGRNLRVKIDPFPTVGANPPDVVANLETQNWSLPMTFRFGTSMELYSIDETSIIANVDYRDERDFRPLVVAGVEVNYDNFIFLRSGLTDQYKEKGSTEYNKVSPTFGSGIRYKLPDTDYYLKFDYSWGEMNRLQQNHRITVGLQF